MFNLMVIVIIQQIPLFFEAPCRGKIRHSEHFCKVPFLYYVGSLWQKEFRCLKKQEQLYSERNCTIKCNIKKGHFQP